MPSPGDTGTPMALVGMTQLTLSPGLWPTLAVMAPPRWRDTPHIPGREGATLQPSCSGRRCRSSWRHQGSPSEVPLPLRAQDLFPLQWPVDAHASPSPSGWALQQPLVLVTPPMAQTQPVLARLLAQEVREQLAAALAAPAALWRWRGAASYRKHRRGSGAADRATGARRRRNCWGRFGRGSDPWVRICRQAAGKGSKSKGASTCSHRRRRHPRAGREPGHRHLAVPPSVGLAVSTDRRAGCWRCCRLQLGTITMPAPSSFGACQELLAGQEGVTGGRRGASLPCRFFRDGSLAFLTLDGFSRRSCCC